MEATVRGREGGGHECDAGEKDVVEDNEGMIRRTRGKEHRNQVEDKDNIVRKAKRRTPKNQLLRCLGQPQRESLLMVLNLRGNYTQNSAGTETVFPPLH